MKYRAIKSAGNIFGMQHAASQKCLSKTSYTFFLSEKEKILNMKAMVTCKRSAAADKLQAPCSK